MTRHLRWLFAAALAVLAPSLTAADAPDSPAPFLWEVQGPKARHYLLGAVHLLPPQAVPPPAALDAAYAATRVLVVDADLDALASPELQGRMLGAAREDRPGGLQAQVGRKLYRKLQARAKSLGMPTPVCADLRAWFCALALALYPLQPAQFSIVHGIARRYFTLARADGRPVATLETAESQIALFAEMPEAQSKQMLAATLDEATVQSQTPEALYRMWRSGDVDTLEEAIRDLRKRYPDLYARILADRNRAWLAPVAERLRQDVPALVVVGAAHLPGADGLLALLKAQGFEASPVSAVAGTPAVSPE
jgi:uncharacterized protein YbaP (TraB family)